MDEHKTNEAGLELDGLFRRSWDLFQKRMETIFLVMAAAISICLLVAGFFVVLVVVLVLAEEKALAVVAGMVGILVLVPVFFWLHLALLLASTMPNMAVGDSLKESFQRSGSYLWLNLLVMVFLFPAMILFLIPGLVMVAWFGLAPYAFVNEKDTGLQALYRAREMVRGRFWQGLGYIMLASFIPSLAGAVPLAGPLLALVATPYVFIFMNEYYQELRNIQGPAAVDTDATTKLAMAGVVLVGLTIFSAGFYFLWLKIGDQVQAALESGLADLLN